MTLRFARVAAFAPLLAAGCSGAAPPSPAHELTLVAQSAAAPQKPAMPAELAAALRLIEPGGKQVGAAVQQIAASGNALARERAAKRLVELAQFVAGPAWRERARPLLDEVNTAAGLAPDADGLAGQLAQYQAEEHARVIAWMGELGGPEIVAYCLSVASAPDNAASPRKAAIAVLEHHGPSITDLAALSAAVETTRLSEPASSVANASVVVASMAKDFRKCWQRELIKDPQLQAVKARLTMKVDGAGAVSSASTSGVDSPTLAACLDAVGKAARFSPPEAGGATVVAPIFFKADK